MKKYIVYMNNGATHEFDSELEMYKWLYEESWEEEGRVVDYGEARFHCPLRFSNKAHNTW